MPVGTEGSPYIGTFDGGGHTVYSLAIGATGSGDDTYAGFFGVIGEGGNVKDLGVKIASFTSACNAGGIAGLNGDTITACYWSGTVTEADQEVDKSVSYDDGGTATDVAKVDGSNVTWTYAQTQMNNALSGTGWKYDGATKTTPPTLKKA